MPSYHIELPYPPTVNSYWDIKGIRTKKTGQLRALKYLTPKARKYRERVAEKMLDQFGKPLRLRDRLIMTVRLHYGPSAESGNIGQRAQDIDNGLKSLLDALEHAEFFVNDEQIDQLLVIKGRRAVVGYVSVIIKTIGE